jgi:Type I site-specific restriction-modification system, R (restriction) subunit and related helicases
MSKQFSETTRVQIPAILHLMRLGYTYIPRVADFDPQTNILTPVFKKKVKEFNPNATDQDVQILFDMLVRVSNNDDLGREFYKKITAITGLKIIDFDNADKNDWHCTAEFTCKNEESGDNFRPDITCFVNGLPLAFIEVKIPNNKDGILAERNRMNQRMANKKFRRFLNVTQLMIFSNNQEYDTENRVPIQGAFYASITKGDIFFNVFREQRQFFYDNLKLKRITEEDELAVLKSFNQVVLSQIPEYQTNKKPDTPTNRVLSSLLSRNRFLFLLRYGFAYVEKKTELENGETIVKLEKHVMRYQQMFASLAIRRKLDQGIKSGIIWHTQGSGKTALAYYSVNSLTDYLAKQNTVAKFYFIVDRLSLMEQAKDEFSARGLRVRTAESRKELMDDFRNTHIVENDSGESEIMVVNIQKFEEDHKKVELPPNYNIRLQRVFFIDEAHRGYNPKGSFLANLLDADRDAIKIALTGTPLLSEERASWKVFGDYIDKYYYDKSIADGYTLKLMREDIETSYKEKLINLLNEAQKTNPQIKKGDVSKDVIIESDNYLRDLMNYIVGDLKRFRIEKNDKTVAGMIVCETNPQARHLFELYNEDSEIHLPHFNQKSDVTYLMAAEPTPNYGTKLNVALILHDEGDKEEREKTIDDFKKKTTIDLLIVNRMLLTGFDASRLKRLYLTRKMYGHDLLQALTRVNRPYKDFKYGYVVDFANIKQNFEDTNNEYLRELNRCDEGAFEDGDNLPPLGPSILEDVDEIKAQLRDIKNVMFAYACENTELFSQQMDEVESLQQLYEIRNVLENAKALSNQIRSFGDEELKAYSEKMEIGAVSDLLNVVNHRIDALNQQEKFMHDDEVSDNVNLILSQIEYEFTHKGSEELRIYNNDLRERADKVMREFDRNFDQQEAKYTNLIEEFKRFFREKGFVPKDVSDAKIKIEYMDDVMKKIREINRANEVLKGKYKQDERFVRIHKRIVEENTERSNRKEKPIISDKEYEIAEGLNQLKDWIDQMIFFKQDILKNEAAFDQDVLSLVSDKMLDLHITSNLTDRKFIQREVAGEYYAQFNQMTNHNSSRLYA